MSDKIYAGLGTCREEIVSCIVRIEIGNSGVIGHDYVKDIALALADDIASDMWECADHDSWNDDDLRMAFGRALCKRLNIDR